MHRYLIVTFLSVVWFPLLGQARENGRIRKETQTTYQADDNQNPQKRTLISKLVDEYNPQGIKTRSTSYGPDGSSKVLSTYDEKTRQGRELRAGGLTALCIYDEMGKLLRCDGYHPHGMHLFRDVYTYDNRGQILSRESYQPMVAYQGGMELVLTDTMTYRYDRGRLTSKEAREKAGRVISSEVYSYNEAGDLAQSERHFGASSWNSKVTYAYDSQGRLSEEIEFGPQGVIIAKTTHSYDPRGRISLRKHFRDGALDGIVETLREYFE